MTHYYSLFLDSHLPPENVGNDRQKSDIQVSQTSNISYLTNLALDPPAHDNMVLNPNPPTQAECIRSSYMDNMTIHGLSKILTGVWWERIVWFSALCICIGVVIHFTIGFYTEYNSHDVRTEIRMHKAQNIPYPAATICPTDSLYSILCYKKKNLGTGYPCSTDTNTLYDQMWFPPSIPKSLLQFRNVAPHPIFTTCLVWNPYGNITSRWQLTQIQFKYFVIYLTLFFHDPNDFFNLAADDAVYANEKDEAKISFSDIQYFSRLPSPHPSNCKQGQFDNNLLPLPGPYTENKCKLNCVLKKSIAECGAIPDQYLTYAPQLQELLPKQSNRTDDDVARCIQEIFFSPSEEFPECHCPVSCTETLFKTKYSVSQHESSHLGPLLTFSFNSKIVTNITDIPSYPPEKFITDIGGWLGLFSGMSLLSLLEVTLFVTLSITAGYSKLKQHLTARRFHVNPSPA